MFSPLEGCVCVTWGRFTCLCRVFRRIGRAALQLLPLAAFLGVYIEEKKNHRCGKEQLADTQPVETGSLQGLAGG